MNDRAGDAGLAAKYDTIAYAAQPSPWSHPTTSRRWRRCSASTRLPCARAACWRSAAATAPTSFRWPFRCPTPRSWAATLPRARSTRRAQTVAASSGFAISTSCRRISATLRDGHRNRSTTSSRTASIRGCRRRCAMRCSRWRRAAWRRNGSCSSATTRFPGATFAARRGTCCISTSTPSPIRARGSTPRAHSPRCSPSRARPRRGFRRCAARGIRADRAAQTDSALFHDDLGVPNDPVYFHEFVAHAGRHGLAFVAEAAVDDDDAAPACAATCSRSSTASSA